MSQEPLTEAIQHYLREIYKLGQETDEPVSVTALARAQGVSAASASAMVKKLAALKLAEHAPYRGVALTPAGERVALEVIRHHRLLELYLAETLGVDVEDVHDEADRLEHAISEELEARIDKALGFPTHDPHGDPIPDANLRWPRTTPPTRVRRPSRARDEPGFERLQHLAARERRAVVAAAVALGDREVVLERGVRLLERVVELVPLEDVVLERGQLLVALLGIDCTADGPDRA